LQMLKKECYEAIRKQYKELTDERRQIYIEKPLREQERHKVARECRSTSFLCSLRRARLHLIKSTYFTAGHGKVQSDRSGSSEKRESRLEQIREKVEPTSRHRKSVTFDLLSVENLALFANVTESVAFFPSYFSPTRAGSNVSSCKGSAAASFRAFQRQCLLDFTVALN